MREETIASISV